MKIVQCNKSYSQKLEISVPNANLSLQASYHYSSIVWKYNQSYSLTPPESASAIFPCPIHNSVINHLPNTPLHRTQVAAWRSRSATGTETTALCIPTTLELILIRSSLRTQMYPISILRSLGEIRESNLILTSIPIHWHNLHKA